MNLTEWTVTNAIKPSPCSSYLKQEEKKKEYKEEERESGKDEDEENENEEWEKKDTVWFEDTTRYLEPQIFSESAVLGKGGVAYACVLLMCVFTTTSTPPGKSRTLLIAIQFGSSFPLSSPPRTLV